MFLFRLDRVAKNCGNIKLGVGGNKPRFPAWGHAPHDGAIGHSSVSGFIVAGVGPGLFFAAGLAEASYKDRIGSANSPDASARRPYLWGGEQDEKAG